MILEWILLIPITGFQQRPLLWFSVNSYTLNFEKGFGKLLKSCAKRDILEIRVLFHANCAAGLLEGKVTKPLCFQIYHKLRQDFRLTRSKMVPALARSSEPIFFQAKRFGPFTHLTNSGRDVGHAIETLLKSSNTPQLKTFRFWPVFCRKRVPRLP